MAQIYTPTETVQFENTVAKFGKGYAMHNQLAVFSEPIWLRLEMYFAIPSGWQKWKRQLAEDNRLLHTGKPDADNILKAVKDALNGIIWKDDSYVMIDRCVKYYSDRESMRISFEPINKYPSQINKKPADFNADQMSI